MKLQATYLGIQCVNTWEHHAWACKVKVGKRVIRTAYRMGLGLSDEPTALDVVASLLRDSEYGIYRFGEFCEELGYREPAAAYDAWKGCVASFRKVKWLWPNGVPEKLRRKCEAL